MGDGTAWDKILLVSISAWRWPCATPLHAQILPGESRSPRRVDIHRAQVSIPKVCLEWAVHTPENTGENTTSSQIPGPRGTSPEPLDMGTKEQPGTGSFCFLSVPWSWPCATTLNTQFPSRENWLPRSADTQGYREKKPHLEAARPDNTTENQMTRG